MYTLAQAVQDRAEKTPRMPQDVKGEPVPRAPATTPPATAQEPILADSTVGEKGVRAVHHEEPPMSTEVSLRVEAFLLQAGDGHSLPFLHLPGVGEVPEGMCPSCGKEEALPSPYCRCRYCGPAALVVSERFRARLLEGKCEPLQ